MAHGGRVSARSTSMVPLEPRKKSPCAHLHRRGLAAILLGAAVMGGFERLGPLAQEPAAPALPAELTALQAAPAPRTEIPIVPAHPPGLPRGWSLKEFVGAAELSVERVGPLAAIRLRSDRSAFAVYTDISLDVAQRPYLSWAWQVGRLPPGGDVRRKETDDQAAQLYVIFPRFPALVRSQVVGYVWDSTAPAGTLLASPSNAMVRIVVLRSGPERLGQWVVESRNVLEDYRRLFGEPPPKARRLSLFINSHHTGSVAESLFAGLVFSQGPLPAARP